METWRPVVDFEEYYEVSDRGRVRSLDRTLRDGRVKIGRVLKPNRLKDGYEQVSLCVDGRVNFMKVHRLVAMAFIQNEENKTDVNHRNGIKHDNRLENLEWVTKSENMKHAYTFLKIPPNRPWLGKKSIRRKLTDEQIRAIRSDKRTRTDIAKDYGVVMQTISNIKLGYYYKEIV